MPADVKYRISSMCGALKVDPGLARIYDPLCEMDVKKAHPIVLSETSKGKGKKKSTLKRVRFTSIGGGFQG